MTFLLDFPPSSSQSWGLLCYPGAMQELKIKLPGLWGLGSWRAPAPEFPLLELLAGAATAEKEGCFLIPACTGLTCLRNRSGWGTASLCSCWGLGSRQAAREPCLAAPSELMKTCWPATGPSFWTCAASPPPSRRLWGARGSLDYGGWFSTSKGKRSLILGIALLWMQKLERNVYFIRFHF